MVEYVGVIRKEAQAVLTPSGVTSQFVLGGGKTKPIDFTPEHFAPQARSRAFTGGGRTRGVMGAVRDKIQPNRRIDENMNYMQQKVAGDAAKRGARWAQRGQGLGRGLGAVGAALAGLVGVAEAGAGGGSLPAALMQGGQLYSGARNMLVDPLGNVAGETAGRIGVATHKDRKPLQLKQPKEQPTAPPSKSAAHGSFDMSTPLNMEALETAPSSIPAAAPAPVAVKTHGSGVVPKEKQHYTNFNPQGFGAATGQKGDRATDENPLAFGLHQENRGQFPADMFDPNYAQSKTGQNVMGRIDQLSPQNAVPVIAPSTPAPAPAAAPVQVMPATAPMDTSQVLPMTTEQAQTTVANSPLMGGQPAAAAAAPVAVEGMSSSEAAAQVASSNLMPGAEGTNMGPKADEVDPYDLKNPSATTHGLDKSTNPRRFVGVI